MNWPYDYGYQIQRRTSSDGEIVWYGCNTNWKKEKNGPWKYLGEDENVKPTKTYYKPDGSVSGHDYPEGRLIFIECEPPIYEKLYQQYHNPAKSAVK